MSRLARAAPARLVLVCLIPVVGACAASREQAPDEYQVKAAFLYNFAKFVEWPAGTFPNAADPVAICILGQDPFGGSLEQVVAGRMIETHPIVVRHLGSAKQAAGCHILFFGRGSAPASEVANAGILTVGDSDSSEDGAVIYFRLEAGKVRFEISLQAAERENVRISSRLLSLAKIVEPKKK
jgi:hypothetical protein